MQRLAKKKISTSTASILTSIYITNLCFLTIKSEAANNLPQDVGNMLIYATKNETYSKKY